MYKVFALQHREGCIVPYAVPRLARIEDLAKHLDQHLSGTICHIRYVKCLGDGSDEVNDNQFVWTGNKLITA